MGWTRRALRADELSGSQSGGFVDTHRVRGVVPPYKITVGEKPYYNAEDDLWFGAVPLLWFDSDLCKVTVTGYRIDDGAWITLRRPLQVAGIPMIDTGMPLASSP